jgi:hypothetical protein
MDYFTFQIRVNFIWGSGDANFGTFFNSENIFEKRFII